MFKVIRASYAAIGLWVLLGSVAAGAEPWTIATLGDSITRGERQGVAAAETFSALLEAALAEHDPPVRVRNLGIGGEKAGGGLGRLQAVLDELPGIVLVMYGTNDSYVDKGETEPRVTCEQFREDLLQLVHGLQEEGVLVVLMTEPAWAAGSQNGAGEDPNVRLAEYMQSARELAAAEGLLLVDHFAHWQEAAAEGVDLNEWTTDGCHPNPRGHAVMAETILPVLRKALEQVPN